MKKVFAWLSFILVAVIVAFTTIVILLPPDMPESALHIAALPSHAGIGLPVRLFIPSINVDAPIGPVGVTDSGAMAVPDGPTDAGWFEFGKRPGENGSSVIVGHFGWKNRIQAVFDDLSTLKAGDAIYVEDEQGAMRTFIVRALENYNPDADASGVFGSSDGVAHLNLITCEGVWSAAEKSYSKRLVVFADKL